MKTSPEIEAIKNAVKPLTPEERVELRATQARIEAIASGELVEVEADTDEPVAGIPQEALKAKARLLGVHVSDLTSDQIEEVRANLPAEEPAEPEPETKPEAVGEESPPELEPEKTRPRSRRRAPEPVVEPEPEPEVEPTEE